MDHFSSPPLQEESMHAEMLLWDFSPEPFDLVAGAPCLLSPPPTEPPPPLAAVPGSAFARYVRSDCGSSRTSRERKNIHQRVIELLRGVPRDRSENRSCEEHSRGFRHMMRERQRRERLSQSYADLHSMLPCRSKPDKNSTVQSAAAYVRELKGVVEELTRRNEELNVRKLKSDSDGAKIKIRVANPSSSSSPIDSMIVSLRRLKAMGGVKATAMQTEFTGHELTAILSIESKVGVSEVERALMDAWR